MSGSGLLYILGVLVVVVGVGVSIALHEIGHLWPAKRFGVKVTQYMVGFGPTIWSRRRGETEYGVKAFPVGGYVRMIGMFPPDPGTGALRASSTGRFSLLVQDAREESRREIAPEDEARTFWRLPVRRRLVVMLGGPVMNLVLATLLFAVTLSVVGTPEPTTSIRVVVECVPTETNPNGLASTDGSCGNGITTAATVLRLRAGDRLVAINGTSVATWSDVSRLLRDRADEQVTITVDRAGEQVTGTTTLTGWTVPRFDAEGNQLEGTEYRGFLGVAPAWANVPQPLSSVPTTMWDLSVRSAVAIVQMPVRVYELAVDTLTGSGRDPDSPVSVVGVADISGTIAADESESARGRIAMILGMLASLNLFLFLFNLLPVLPLDGGHVAGALWEATRRQWAAWRGRPDPGPVDVARALPLAYAVTIVLLLIGSVVIVADLVNPLSI